MPLLNQLRLAPRVMSSLVTLLLLPLFVYLGHWQLTRMMDKKIIESKLENQTPVAWNAQNIETNFDQHRYQILEIQGQFLNEKNILLDNQTFKGQAGYRVFTPFLPKNSTEKVLLIDRGWIPCETRSILPSVSAMTGQIHLKGVLNKLSSGILLKKEVLPDLIEEWPIRVQNIPFETLGALLKHEVYPFVLQLSENSPYGFTLLPLNTGIPSNRHLGYAVQWFAMAAMILIYYLVINLRRQK